MEGASELPMVENHGFLMVFALLEQAEMGRPICVRIQVIVAHLAVYFLVFVRAGEVFCSALLCKALGLSQFKKGE